MFFWCLFEQPAVVDDWYFSRGVLRKSVLKTCSKFAGEHSCQSVISIKLLCNFIEITPRHGCLPANFLRISRTPFYKNTYGGLLLFVEFLQNSIIYNFYNNKQQKQSFADVLQSRCSPTPTLLKRELRHRRFLVHIAKILITAIFREHLWWLLLK